MLGYHPAPAPPGVFQNVPFPKNKASFLSKFFVHYVTPIMKVGASRPLESEDLWELTPDLKCEETADRLEANFMARMPPSRRIQKYKASLIPPVLSQSRTEENIITETTHLLQQPIPKFSKIIMKQLAEGEMVFEDGKVYDMSLAKAVFKTCIWSWLFAVSIGVVGGVLAPLLTQQIIRQLHQAYQWKQANDGKIPADGLEPPNSIVHGIALAVGLFLMLFMRNALLMQARMHAAIMGIVTRAAVIDLISRKSMRLSGKARIDINNGRIITSVTSDSAYLDWCLPNSIAFPSHPIIVIVASALLIKNLGYSALVGIGALVLSAPIQGWLFKRLMYYRRKQNQEVDKRVRLLSEIISAIRAVKMNAWETFFAKKISDMRQKEHDQLYIYSRFRSSVNALFSITPYLSSILAFIAYALSGHDLDPVKIFTCLHLFDILRYPLQDAPIFISQAIDCLSGLNRIGIILRAEELPEKLLIDPGLAYAVEVKGDFGYDSVAVTTSQECTNPSTEEADGRKVEEPFTLRNVAIQIPHGSLVCVVGRVGTGKTALLSGMINEMRQSRGFVKFGGKVTYVPQVAWLQSATLRDNILFGSNSKNADLNRLNEVIDACGLRPDVDAWHDADLTLIGERGITLSGGQRQRVCIARAAYQESEVCLLDDPLSAVDAHVGQHLVEHCIMSGPLAHRTRILVTHQLDIVHLADLILVMDCDEQNVGRIVQQGTYQDLLCEPGVFQRLMEEYGSRKTASLGRSSSAPTISDNGQQGALEIDADDVKRDKQSDEGEPKAKGHLVEKEERVVGAVRWDTYRQYARAIGSPGMIIFVILMLILAQCATIGNNMFLGAWSGRTIEGFSTKQYMTIYGVGFNLCYSAGFPASIFQPLQRCMGSCHSVSRLIPRCNTFWPGFEQTEQRQMADEKLGQSLVALIRRAFFVLGILFLVNYTYSLLRYLFFPLLAYLTLCSLYYRQTSREIKRLESILRSAVYSSFAEQLAGLAVVRAFAQQDTFRRRLAHSIDEQNRASILNAVSQRWLGIRVELASQLLVLAIAICGVAYRDDMNPAKLGVVLVYAISTTDILTELLPGYAHVEQEMNAVERILHYTQLPMEAEPVLPTDPPESVWPSTGALEFKDVEMRYRPDLPLILKGVSFSIKAGEKVGIVGRTGAGKSSIAQALFRAVEPCGGVIEVDGVDLQSVGLDTLRNRLAIIPQDPFFFEGSTRENIDPQGLYSDAQLNDVLNLVHQGSSSKHLRERFRLDARILTEGSNLSAGEKQLLALVRAIMRKSKVLFLDEATSSVNPETDALIQKIIQTELRDVTLISIAHRLSTIAYYDRVLGLDSGRVIEYDTPLALFDSPHSLFRSLCDKKDMSREDIVKLQAEAATASRNSLNKD